MTTWINMNYRIVPYIPIPIPLARVLGLRDDAICLGESAQRWVVPPGLVEVHPVPLFALTGVAVVGQPGAFFVAILTPGHVAQALHHAAVGVYRFGQALQEAFFY